MLVELLHKRLNALALGLHLPVCRMILLADSLTISRSLCKELDRKGDELSPSCCFMRSSYSDEGTLPQMRLLISAQGRLSKMGGNVCQTLTQSAKACSLSSHQR